MHRLVGAVAVLTFAGCDTAPNRLFAPVPFPAFESMTCTLKSVASGVLNPSYYRDRAGSDLSLVIGELNHEAGTATVHGNNGGAAVEFRPSHAQMQFIETTPMGSLTVTTVFAPSQIGDPLPVVHSRHIMVSPANVSISQFAGECLPG